ncbi:MAG TPA: ammonium transporter [Polyangiaceae bacterium]|jgi:Amt family ammonium transporter|nr:ammonium transporter [Polyangiaceae bacterium]
MLSSHANHHRRRWPALIALLVALIGVLAPSGARADTPGPDPIGAYQTTPTAASVPGYTKIDPDKATTKDLAVAIDAVAQSTSRSYFSINFVWVLVAGFLVIFMQAGFALVETGLIRAKNAAHTFSMNFAVYALGMFGFFVCGFALMCGGFNGTGIGGPVTLGGLPTMDQMFTIGASVNGDHGWGLFGTTGFFLSGKGYDSAAIVMFLFMMAFMDTTATIVTGACAERWTYKSFFIYSIFIGGFIYPIFGCWVWGGGWLAQIGYRLGLGHGAVDYAGSGVVHLQGGALALITAILIGPRIGKFNKDGSVNPILAHDIPMVQLGTFILAFGWFGFNAGSSLAGTDGRIGIVAVNTMIAGMAATLSGIMYMWVVVGKPDPSMMCNSMLAGLVAITSPCAFVTPMSAFIIGGIAGVLVVWSVFFFDKIKIDDPVGAISVHGVNGLWGLIAVGLFSDGTYGAGWNGVGATDYLGKAGQGVTGLFYGDGKQLVAQLVEGGVCIAWNVVVGGVIFYVLGKVVGNRVSAEVEIAGLDIPEMGVPGYPEFITHGLPESGLPAEAKMMAPAGVAKEAV